MRNPAAAVRDPNLFETPSGDLYHTEYSPVINDDGTFRLVESGKTDIKQHINAQVPFTDINYIIGQIKAGNTSVLNQREPLYGDFTEMPTTLSGALNLVIKGEHDFDHLPVDVKAKFDNDFRKWFSTAGSPEWFSAMGVVPSGNPVGDNISLDPIEKPVKNPIDVKE